MYNRRTMLERRLSDSGSSRSSDSDSSSGTFSRDASLASGAAAGAGGGNGGGSRGGSNGRKVASRKRRGGRYSQEQEVSTESEGGESLDSFIVDDE